MAGGRLRILFLNTFLLRVRLLAGLPGPDHAFTAPAVPERAGEIGRRLVGDYDVVALAEVFDRPERDAVLAAWTGRPAEWADGPGRSRWPPALATSGLLTIADGLPITRSDRHTFGSRGRHLRDTDAWANKGVLFVEIDVGLGDRRLEVASTHLIAGGDLLAPHGRAEQAIASDRQRQVGELVAFVGQVHRPGNATLVVGDLNVEGTDPEARAARRLQDTMGEAGFADVWLTHGRGPGPTCNLLHLGEELGGEEDGFSIDGPDAPPEAERIDYAFFRSGAAPIEVSAVRRRSLPRGPDAPEREELAFLSDHLALHLELDLRAPPS